MNSRNGSSWSFDPPFVFRRSSFRWYHSHASGSRIGASPKSVVPRHEVRGQASRSAIRLTNCHLPAANVLEVAARLTNSTFGRPPSSRHRVVGANPPRPLQRNDRRFAVDVFFMRCTRAVTRTLAGRVAGGGRRKLRSELRAPANAR